MMTFSEMKAAASASRKVLWRRLGMALGAMTLDQAYEAGFFAGAAASMEYLGARTRLEQVAQTELARTQKEKGS